MAEASSAARSGRRPGPRRCRCRRVSACGGWGRSRCRRTVRPPPGLADADLDLSHVACLPAGVLRLGADRNGPVRNGGRPGEGACPTLAAGFQEVTDSPAGIRATMPGRWFASTESTEVPVPTPRPFEPQDDSPPSPSTTRSAPRSSTTSPTWPSSARPWSSAASSGWSSPAPTARRTTSSAEPAAREPGAHPPARRAPGTSRPSSPRSTTT